MCQCQELAKLPVDSLLSSFAAAAAAAGPQQHSNSNRTGLGWADVLLLGERGRHGV